MEGQQLNPPHPPTKPPPSPPLVRALDPATGGMDRVPLHPIPRADRGRGRPQQQADGDADPDFRFVALWGTGPGHPGGQRCVGITQEPPQFRVPFGPGAALRNGSLDTQEDRDPFPPHVPRIPTVDVSHEWQLGRVSPHILGLSSRGVCHSIRAKLAGGFWNEIQDCIVIAWKLTTGVGFCQGTAWVGILT